MTVDLFGTNTGDAVFSPCMNDARESRSSGLVTAGNTLARRNRLIGPAAGVGGSSVVFGVAVLQWDGGSVHGGGFDGSV